MKKIVAFFFLSSFASAVTLSTVYNPWTGKQDYINTSTGGGGSSLPLPAGATNYIQNASVLQSGATFYISSGTVNGQLTSGPIIVKTDANFNLLKAYDPTFCSAPVVSWDGTSLLQLGDPTGSCGTASSVTLNDGPGTYVNLSQGSLLFSEPANVQSNSGSLSIYGNPTSFGGPAGPLIAYVSSVTVNGSLGLNVIYGLQAGSITINSPNPVNFEKFSASNTQGTIEFFQSGVNDHLIQMSGNNMTIPSDNLLVTGGFLTVFGAFQTNGAIESVDSGASPSALLAGILDLWSASGNPSYVNWNEHGVANRGAFGFLGGSSTLIYQPSVEILGSGTTKLSIDSSGDMAIGTVTSNPTRFSMSVSTGSGIYAFAVSTMSHISGSGTAPTPSSCGSTPNATMAAGSNDWHGTINVGGGIVTSCVLTFTKPWSTNSPDCITGDNSGSISSGVTSKSQTAITITTSATLGGGTISYICFGSE